MPALAITNQVPPKGVAVASAQMRLPRHGVFIPRRSFMPEPCGDVVDPRRLGIWYIQHVEAMALVLIGVGYRTVKVPALLEPVFDRMGADALRRVAVSSPDDARPKLIGSQPEQGIVEVRD